MQQRPLAPGKMHRPPAQPTKQPQGWTHRPTLGAIPGRNPAQPSHKGIAGGPDTGGLIRGR